MAARATLMDSFWRLSLTNTFGHTHLTELRHSSMYNM